MGILTTIRRKISNRFASRATQERQQQSRIYGIDMEDGPDLAAHLVTEHDPAANKFTIKGIREAGL